MEVENDDYHKKERATAATILVFASLSIASLFVAFSYYCYIRNKVAKRFKNRTCNTKVYVAARRARTKAYVTLRRHMLLHVGPRILAYVAGRRPMLLHVGLGRRLCCWPSAYVVARWARSLHVGLGRWPMSLHVVLGRRPRMSAYVAARRHKMSAYVAAHRARTSAYVCCTLA
ncbi:hypothetical protein RND71_012813 [Anisodus tanguticus]|uniref:Uncharacterized protein n=1 Tax=Anisodus tanguticus TaxID=243964 RepID=A0AAE1SHU3_9SOLA|nr:hypothetical protein RND71_012813 [Anisodus tanguticus]